MGVLKRLLIPRKVRRAAHPVRTARRAVTPKPIKKIKRSVYVATNPVGALHGAAENAAVKALRPKGGGGKSRSTTGSKASRYTAPRTRSPKPSQSVATMTSSAVHPGNRSVYPAPSGDVIGTASSKNVAGYGFLSLLAVTTTLIISAAAGWPAFLKVIFGGVALAAGVGCIRRKLPSTKFKDVLLPQREIERKEVVFHWSGDQRIEFRIGALSKTWLETQRRADTLLQRRIDEELLPLKNDGWVLDGSFLEAVSFAHDSRSTFLGRKNTYRGATVQIRREK